jgi:hypothetical protein
MTVPTSRRRRALSSRSTASSTTLSYDDTDDEVALTFAFEASVSPVRWVLSFACPGLEGDWISGAGTLEPAAAMCVAGGAQVSRNTPEAGITDSATGSSAFLFQP